MEENKSRLCRTTTAAMACRTVSGCRQVGGLPFWVFSVAIRWRRWVGTDFSGLFGFGPKSGGFVVQKRNETPETPETFETPKTLCVVARIAFL